MEGYLRKDLVPGVIYRCQISGVGVLITSQRMEKTTSGTDTYVVYGKYYNSITGLWEISLIHDGQLMEIRKR